MVAGIFIHEPKIKILEEFKNIRETHVLNESNLINSTDEILFNILEQIHTDTLFLYLKKYMNESLAMIIYQILFTIQLSLVFFIFMFFIILPIRKI